jgi:hypothetical protein
LQKRPGHSCVDRYTDRLTWFRFDLTARRPGREGRRHRQRCAAATGVAPASSLGFDLRCTNWRAACTRVKRGPRRSCLGWRGRRVNTGDGARLGGADGSRRRPPVSARRRYTARGLQRATPAASSPPHEPSDLLHDEGTTATEGNQQRRRRPRVVRRQRRGVARVWGFGAAARYKGAGRP